MYVECTSYSTSKTYADNNQQVKLGMVELIPFNKLMMTSATTQPEHFPGPSTNLLGNQIRMSFL